MSAPINAASLPPFEITSLGGLVDRARTLMEEGQQATQTLQESEQHLSMVCVCYLCSEVRETQTICYLGTEDQARPLHWGLSNIHRDGPRCAQQLHSEG